MLVVSTPWALPLLWSVCQSNLHSLSRPAGGSPPRGAQGAGGRRCWRQAAPRRAGLVGSRAGRRFVALAARCGVHAEMDMLSFFGIDPLPHCASGILAAHWLKFAAALLASCCSGAAGGRGGR